MFDDNIGSVESMLGEERKKDTGLDGTRLKRIEYILKLSRMYRSDSSSFLDKGDTDTSFSCISYAHGLLDAMRELLNGDVFENRKEDREGK